MDAVSTPNLESIARRLTAKRELEALQKSTKQEPQTAAQWTPTEPK